MTQGWVLGEYSSGCSLQLTLVSRIFHPTYKIKWKRCLKALFRIILLTPGLHLRSGQNLFDPVCILYLTRGTTPWPTESGRWKETGSSMTDHWGVVRSSRPTALTCLERVTGYAFMFLISAATAKFLRFKTNKSDGGNGGSEPNLYKAKCASLIARLFATLQIDDN